MIIAFILGLLAIPLFIYGGALVFLLLPVIAIWKQFKLGERWMRIAPDKRKTIWQLTLLGSSVLTWGFIVKGAA